MQAEAEDAAAGWWRQDRRAPAAPAAAARQAAAAGTALDSLLFGLGEPRGPGATDGMQLPALPALAMPPPLPAPAARGPPGAPRRHARPLPPPPEVPAELLAAFQPVHVLPPPPLERCGSTDASTVGAVSRAGSSSDDEFVHPALFQAAEWMSEIAQARALLHA